MRNFTKKYGSWALVTGASTGIGEEIARGLAKSGMNIILVARSAERLEATARSLVSEAGVQTRVIVEDLADPEATDRIAAAVDGLDIGVLIPNAGTIIDGAFIESSPERQRQLVNLNVLAPTLMARHFGALMAKRGRGAILFISSLFAYQGIPLFASYAASKSYILNLGEALNAELKPCGVDVTVLSPGLTRTEMTANIPIKWSRLPMLPMKPARVARVGLRSLGRKASVVPGLLNKIYAWENRLLPRMAPTKLFGFLIKNAMRAAATEKS